MNIMILIIDNYYQKYLYSLKNKNNLLFSLTFLFNHTEWFNKYNIYFLM